MRIGKITAACALAVIGLGLAEAPKADAAYVAYLYQDGSNVVVTGSGSIDIAGLSLYGTASDSPHIAPIYPDIGIGDAATIDIYQYVTPPLLVGSTFTIDSTSASGSAVEFGTFGVGVPHGYVSSTQLGTSTDTWDSTTLAALGVNDGTFVWHWGKGPDADIFTLHIGSAPPTTAPEPASSALLGAGLVGLVLRRRLPTVARRNNAARR